MEAPSSGRTLKCRCVRSPGGVAGVADVADDGARRHPAGGTERIHVAADVGGAVVAGHAELATADGPRAEGHDAGNRRQDRRAPWGEQVGAGVGPATGAREAQSFAKLLPGTGHRAMSPGMRVRAVSWRRAPA